MPAPTTHNPMATWWDHGKNEGKDADSVKVPRWEGSRLKVVKGRGDEDSE